MLQLAPDEILQVKLPRAVVEMLQRDYGVRDIHNPVQVGLAVMRLLKEEKRAAEHQ